MSNISSISLCSIAADDYVELNRTVRVETSDAFVDVVVFITNDELDEKK